MRYQENLVNCFHAIREVFVITGPSHEDVLFHFRQSQFQSQVENDHSMHAPQLFNATCGSPSMAMKRPISSGCNF